jgi:hypothetical protein
MRRTLLRRAGAWLVSLAAVLAVSAHADTRTVPFSAAVDFTETVNFTYQLPCFALGTLAGSGSSNVMGAVQASSLDCINPQGTFDPNAPSFVFASLPPGFALVDAKGHRLMGSYAGTLTYRPGAPHALAGYFVITGGTGRYSGAIGGGTVSGSEDISGMTTGRGSVVLNGQIKLAR